MENKKRKIESIGEQTWKFVEEEINTDCIINVKNNENNLKTFKLHKMMLMKSSPVFKIMFDIDMSEGRTGIVDIEDIEPRIMEMAFKHMYGCKFSVNELTGEDMKDLVFVADKYQIATLLKFCSKYTLQKLISPKNFKLLLKLRQCFLNSIYIENLEAQMIKILEKNTEECILDLAENLLNISEEDLLFVLKHSKYNLKSEIDLIKFVDEWAVAQIKQQDTDVDERKLRNLIEPQILPLLRFLTLTKEELMEFCLNYNWFNREENKILQINISGEGEVPVPLNISKDPMKRCNKILKTIIYGDMKQVDCNDIAKGFYDLSVEIAIPKDLLSVKLSNQNIIHLKHNKNNRPKACSFNFEIDSDQYSLVGFQTFTEPNFELNKNVYHEETNVLIKCNGSIIDIVTTKLLARYNSIITTTFITPVNLKISSVYSIHSDYVSDKKYYKYASPIQEIKLDSNYMLLTGDIGFFRALILKKNSI